MHAYVYEKLRDFYHSHPIGFPRTELGIELKIMERLFAEEKAEAAMKLTSRGRTAADIAAEMAKEPGAVAEILDRMSRKGLILKQGDIYRLIPFIPGIYEFQLNRMDESLAHDFEELYPHLAKEIFSSPTSFARVVPVERHLPLEIEVAPFERASEIVRNTSKIALAECLCRKEQKLVGKGCSHPKDDICLVFSPMAEHYIDMDLGREVSVEEALKAVRRGEETALVRCTLNVQRRPTFMCQCCSCCCALLRGVYEMGIPTAVAKSNFIPTIDPELCNGCESCVEICPMDALSLEDEKAVVDLGRCLGCGLCVSECPMEAISLKAKEEKTMPPANFTELMKTIAQEKGKTYF